MAEERIRVAPSVCAYVDGEHTQLTIDIVIPGVQQEDIDLKMHYDSLSLCAPRESIEYVTALSFCCPVNPDKAEAMYDNGLLRIEVPFRDPMEDAVRVPVRTKQGS